MRYVAFTAATLSSAFFLALGSPALPFGDANNSNTNSITKPKTSTVQIASAATEDTNKTAAAAETEAPALNMVTINQGDTLSSIAANHSTTFNRLYDANDKVTDPNIIFPGDQLRIPTADEQLTERPLPTPAVAAAPVTQSAPDVVAPAPVRTQQPVSQAPAVAGGGVWDRLAQCEAGGNWSINTGNGFYGGLQFTLGSWQAVGGTGMPNQASREEQILRGQMLQARQGWGAWPACSAKLGL